MERTFLKPGLHSEEQPPILPHTGTYKVEEDRGWLEQSKRFDGTYLTSINVEERSEHFGMTWGGNYEFGSGNCRVAPDYTFSCPTSEVSRGEDTERASVFSSKMTGRIISTFRMEVQNEVEAWCEGTGCPPDDEGFYGVEAALLVIQNGG